MSKPCVCPVCNGRGTMDPGFYKTVIEWHDNAAATEVQCRTCWGHGVLWAPDDEVKWDAPKTTAGGIR